MANTNLGIKCENCKHSYSYFKRITSETGLPEFVVSLRCRLDYEINEDGTPGCNGCFETRQKV